MENQVGTTETLSDGFVAISRSSAEIYQALNSLIAIQSVRKLF